MKKKISRNIYSPFNTKMQVVLFPHSSLSRSRKWYRLRSNNLAVLYILAVWNSPNLQQRLEGCSTNFQITRLSSVLWIEWQESRLSLGHGDMANPEALGVLVAPVTLLFPLVLVDQRSLVYQAHL